MKSIKGWLQPLVILTALILFYNFLFYKDNKYQNPPPYGKAGVITLCESDLRRNDPVFLIDGWLLTDERVTERPTYIGEFSNLQRGTLSVSPHGRACYQMTLCYEGAPQNVTVDFPQLSSRFQICLDGVLLAQGTGNGRIAFLLTEGSHVLTVETVSRMGYYSGMYFPPALSTTETFLQVHGIQSFAYGFAFLLPVILTVLMVFLWRSGSSFSRLFGALCCCYALYMLRYFVFWLSVPAAEYWFWIQSLAMYGLCFCVVQLMALTSGAGDGRLWRWMRRLLLLLPAVLCVLGLLIPIVSWSVFIHGKLTDVYYIATFVSTVFLAVRGIAVRGWQGRYTLSGCLVFGVGLVTNLICSNRFEPIRFFWQFEWCGLFLVLLFGVMMTSLSRRILRENDMLTNHLEEQVKKRTEEVTRLLDERKAFFSDMAHDLKAPVFATQSFIQAIRKSGLGVDAELRQYLDQAEAKQWEMARRLQGLSTINALDKIKGERIRISVRELFSEIYAFHHGEAEVQSVWLVMEPPGQDVFLLAQPEKLNILFENLIYNALRATPCNGSITISAKAESGRLFLTVADTGRGIPENELPFIFERFYVGADNRETGTGLGLYIVKNIVEEFGGTVSVSSAVGQGTVFIMEFPQDL